ncbi:MAG TPA: lysophospholipid acyltransferase family protein [Acidimicrobiales bacterium]|nr:lysophospholipid acyltransferase family protein [Acidimicrobiales bacterium]
MLGRGKRQYGWLYPVARAVLMPVFRLGWRIHTEGADNLPTAGGAVICPNHVSAIDSFLLPSVLPRRITFVGKAEYLDNWKTKHLFPALGMIPIDRSGGDSSRRALDAAAGVLETGELFGIYPEGTRSRDGRLHRGHTGPARLALRTGAPLVPVGLIGTREIQPPGRNVPQPFRPCAVRIGRPIDVGHYRDRPDDHLVLRELTDELMFEIRELSGQDYVDEYATRKPDGLPSQPAAVVANGGNEEAGATGRPAAGTAQTLSGAASRGR